MRADHKVLSYCRKLLITHQTWIIVRQNRATLTIHVIGWITLTFNTLDVGRDEIALKWINFDRFTICSFGWGHRGIEVAGACRTSNAYKDRVNVFLGLFAHFIDNRPGQIFRYLSSCISRSSFGDWHFLLVTFWWTVFISNLMLVLALFRYNRMMWLIFINFLFGLDLESDTSLRYLLFWNASGYNRRNVIILFLFRDEQSLCWLMILSVILLNLHLRF